MSDSSPFDDAPETQYEDAPAEQQHEEKEEDDEDDEEEEQEPAVEVEEEDPFADVPAPSAQSTQSSAPSLDDAFGAQAEPEPEQETALRSDTSQHNQTCPPRLSFCSACCPPCITAYGGMYRHWLRWCVASFGIGGLARHRTLSALQCSLASSSSRLRHLSSKRPPFSPRCSPMPPSVRVRACRTPMSLVKRATAPRDDG